MIHLTRTKLASLGVFLLNGVLFSQAMVAANEPPWIGMLVAASPLPLIWFPGVFAEMGRWGFMASLASDFSQGIPPVAISFLGWILMLIMTAIVILNR